MNPIHILNFVWIGALTFCHDITHAQESVTLVPVTDFEIPDDLELRVWASSPFLFNPTNMDTDRDGRIWVTEGVNYRRTMTRPEGDRIVVLEDTDRDGMADSSHVFIQDTELISPLGISAFDNKIVVAQTPSILVCTDVDRDLKFNPEVDTREELITGFNGRNHDHSLHATIAGPDGKWYFNQGNCGAQIQDKDGRVFQSGGPYYNRGAGSPEWFNDTRSYAGKPSADGNIYQGGFAGRMNPDGSNIEILGHGFRNSYELCLSSLGDIFQNDNDDPPACRNTWLMEGGNLGFFSKDGTRTWQADRRPGQPITIAHWRQEDPGILPAGDVYGPGSPTGMTFYEHGALPSDYEGMLLSCEARARVIQRYHPKLSINSSEVALGKRSHLLSCDSNNLFRPSDIMVGADGALYISDWFDPGVGGHRAADTSHSGTIYRLAPKGFKPVISTRKNDPLKDALELLKSPAIHVRYTGFEKLKSMGAAVYPHIKKLSQSKNHWHAARAVWLLPYLGAKGIEACRERLKHPKPQQRILAFRALRSAGHDVIRLGASLGHDQHPAVRRSLAVALRDINPMKKLPLVIELWKEFDGKDHHYLEACGLASEDIEAQVWKQLRPDQPKNPLHWSKAFQRITWRLSPEEAVPSLVQRSQICNSHTE
jgi:putative membrane-bound dehydrogenase-like protein